jgi:hypothetical protein
VPSSGATDPSRQVSTVNVYNGKNTAVTDLSLFIVRFAGFCERVSPPVQCDKFQPCAGVACMLSNVPALYTPPLGVTVPLPTGDTDVVSVYVVGGLVASASRNKWILLHLSCHRNPEIQGAERRGST